MGHANDEEGDEESGSEQGGRETRSRVEMWCHPSAELLEVRGSQIKRRATVWKYLLLRIHD